jgi:hypothetical protein
MPTDSSLILAKLIVQGVISLAVLGIGVFLCCQESPDVRASGAGLIGLVTGYWTR